MNTEITEETEREINRGKRILEFFNQASGTNYTAEEETILLYTGTSGYTDYIAIEIVSQLKVELIEYFKKVKDKYKKLIEISASKSADDKDFSPVEEYIKDYMTNNATDAAKALKEAWDKKNAPAAPAVPAGDTKEPPANSANATEKPNTNADTQVDQKQDPKTADQKNAEVQNAKPADNNQPPPKDQPEIKTDNKSQSESKESRDGNNK